MSDHDQDANETQTAASGATASQPAPGLSRREMLTGAAASAIVGGVALATGCKPAPVRTTFIPRNVDQAFTFVHLTDMHVRKKRRGDDGYRACIGAVQALPERPDFALMGGDMAFDGLYTEKDEFSNQLDLYREISDTMGIPYYNALGNHDILGWSARRKVPVNDPDIGKKMAMDRLGMAKSYYSFDHKGWHFAILDSLFPIEKDTGPEYEARLGDEQLDWLAKDLGAAAAAGKHIVCMTHIAAFCNIGTINGDPDAKAMSPGMVLRDSKDLRLILERHGAKALLQGHSHMTEDFTYNGVNYLTSPAVSAAWWGGNWLGFEPGFTIFRVNDDKLTWRRVTFPWSHQLEREDDTERKKNAEYKAFLLEQKRLRELEQGVAVATP